MISTNSSSYRVCVYICMYSCDSVAPTISEIEEPISLAVEQGEKAYYQYHTVVVCVAQVNVRAYVSNVTYIVSIVMVQQCSGANYAH